MEEELFLEQISSSDAGFWDVQSTFQKVHDFIAKENIESVKKYIKKKAIQSFSELIENSIWFEKMGISKENINSLQKVSSLVTLLSMAIMEDKWKWFFVLKIFSPTFCGEEKESAIPQPLNRLRDIYLWLYSAPMKNVLNAALTSIELQSLLSYLGLHVASSTRKDSLIATILARWRDIIISHDTKYIRKASVSTPSMLNKDLISKPISSNKQLSSKTTNETLKKKSLLSVNTMIAILADSEIDALRIKNKLIWLAQIAEVIANSYNVHYFEKHSDDIWYLSNNADNFNIERDEVLCELEMKKCPGKARKNTVKYELLLSSKIMLGSLLRDLNTNKEDLTTKEIVIVEDLFTENVDGECLLEKHRKQNIQQNHQQMQAILSTLCHICIEHIELEEGLKCVQCQNHAHKRCLVGDTSNWFCSDCKKSNKKTVNSKNKKQKKDQQKQQSQTFQQEHQNEALLKEMESIKESMIALKQQMVEMKTQTKARTSNKRKKNSLYDIKAEKEFVEFVNMKLGETDTLMDLMKRHKSVGKGVSLLIGKLIQICDDDGDLLSMFPAGIAAIKTATHYKGLLSWVLNNYSSNKKTKNEAAVNALLSSLSCNHRSQTKADLGLTKDINRPTLSSGKKRKGFYPNQINNPAKVKCQLTKEWQQLAKEETTSLTGQIEVLLEKKDLTEEEQQQLNQLLEMKHQQFHKIKEEHQKKQIAKKLDEYKELNKQHLTFTKEQEKNKQDYEKEDKELLLQYKKERNMLKVKYKMNRIDIDCNNNINDPIT